MMRFVESETAICIWRRTGWHSLDSKPRGDKKLRSDSVTCIEHLFDNFEQKLSDRSIVFNRQPWQPTLS